jgi:hypothetical protein
MFSLNLYGIFVFTMFNKSHIFLTWAVLHKQLLCRAIPLTLQHPLEKAHAVASSSVTFTTNIQDRGPFKHNNSRIVS